MPDQHLLVQIAALSDASASVRKNAATAIFNAGAELIAPLLQQWHAYSEMAACISSAGPPQITVGIAVQTARFDEIRNANGTPPLADVPPDQDAKEFELDFPGGARLDVLTSTGPGGSGAIARYLKKFGEGIQQIEVNVSDVDHATQMLRSQFGVEPIYPATRTGANQTKVNFFLISIPGGGKLLVELVEK
ncbi:MAG TPA: hypothetical protein VFW94_17925 [Candidatus Acidoferrales bacterium]|nr:hypothetical protein [Candidatus Acidoferrales bacterium]